MQLLMWQCLTGQRDTYEFQTSTACEPCNSWRFSDTFLGCSFVSCTRRKRVILSCPSEYVRDYLVITWSQTYCISVSDNIGVS
jgi:hypothetical protein